MKRYNDITKIIHRDGYFFILLFAACTFVISSLGFQFATIGSLLTAWCIFFFRDPVRQVPQNEDLILCPADGVVQSIVESLPPLELGLGDVMMTRVSIFLNIFNVHVNRNPVSGKVLKLHYNPGKFFNASLDKASIHNERQSVVVEAKGNKIVFVQIAGLIAKRIVCDLEENQEIKAGERFGIIRFGSRMDVYMPKEFLPLVTVGQIAIAGETVIGNMSSQVEYAFKSI